MRKIGPDGSVSLLAGSRATDSSAFGAVDGNAATARFNVIGGLAVGPDGALYVSDSFNNAVRRVDGAGNVTTYAGVLGQSGSADGPIASARLYRPGSLAFGPDGSLYVSDSGQLRRISADGTTVSTFPSLGSNASGQVFDRDGTLYFAGATGLWSLSPGATSATLVIPGNAADMVVLGATPHLSNIGGLAVLGPPAATRRQRGTATQGELAVVNRVRTFLWSATSAVDQFERDALRRGSLELDHPSPHFLDHASSSVWHIPDTTRAATTPDRVVLGNEVIEALRQQAHLAPILSFDESLNAADAEFRSATSFREKDLALVMHEAASRNSRTRWLPKDAVALEEAVGLRRS